MPGSSIGKLFSVTTYGESHGPAIGCIIDGCPPMLQLTEQDIQVELDRRRPAQSKYVSQRREPDRVQILSGVFAGKTTGTPIGLQILNQDQRERDYADLESTYRPGHGDYTYQQKYGIRDHRGGGRASARETALRVAAGAIAKKFLREQLDINFAAQVVQVGNVVADLASMQEHVAEVRSDGDSIGAKLQLIISNVVAGLGEPVFDRLHADLAHALFSINAVKGVEFGAGFACVTARGSEFNDPITMDGFTSNNAGGTLAGISTGQDIVANIAFKPTSSIPTPTESINSNGDPVKVATKGRHDPCVGLRAPAIVEAMAAIVICDHVLRHRGQNGNFK